jgi:hypothetical protein
MGQLGDGTITNNPIPQLVNISFAPTLTGKKNFKLACGSGHTCLTSSSFCFGIEFDDVNVCSKNGNN